MAAVALVLEIRYFFKIMFLPNILQRHFKVAPTEPLLAKIMSLNLDCKRPQATNVSNACNVRLKLCALILVVSVL